MVERPSSDPARFAIGARLWLGEDTAEVVLSRRVGGGRLAIKLDRPATRGDVLGVRRGDLPPPEPDHYYVFQLIGLEVVEQDGRPLGRVQDVLPGTANDNLELDDGTLVPMVEDAIAAVEVEAGRVVLNPGFIT